MQLIQTVTVGSGGASSITFSSIAQTYTDLLIVLSLRNTSSSDAITLNFSGSTSNFSSRKLEGNGTSASSTTRTDNQFPFTQVVSTYTANTFSSASLYIPNYALATNHSFSIDSVTENNATGSYQNTYAGLHSTAAAITSIVVGSLANNFAQYSSASLYGITRGSDGIVTIS